jgi:hypothetical protein
MTAELVRGQNRRLPTNRLEIRVSVGEPVLAGATLGDEQGTVRSADWVARPGSPKLPGIEVSQQAAADHRLAVDLDAMPEAAHRVHVLLALPTGIGGPLSFGAVAAPFVAVTGLDGSEIASYTITGLDSESAVIAVELYRRQGAWKVRAVGQGYAGGLAAMLQDQGLPHAAALAATINDAVVQGMARSVPPGSRQTAHRPAAEGGRLRTPATAGNGGGGDNGTRADGEGVGGPPSPAAVPPPRPATPGRIDYRHPRRPSPGRPQEGPPPPGSPAPAPFAPPGQPQQPGQPVAGDATGWTMDERLYNQVWGMFEDLARAAAAYRSAVDFADSRMEQELDRALSDPCSRIGAAGETARDEARAKHTHLVDQARAALDRDLDQLTAEAEVVEVALPAAFARWDSPVWQAYRVPMEIPMALRLGDLHLPERPELRIPMLIRLPLERGLWVDSGRTGSAQAALVGSAEMRRLAMDTVVAHAARMLAVYPPGECTVHVLDPAGAAAPSLAPLTQSGVLREPPATGAGGVAAVMAKLTHHIDLVQMAVRAGVPDALPPELDTAEQLLIVNDFPHGFDDRAITQLRYIADEGPSAGVHLMTVADREDARAYGPVLDPLWRSLLRITPIPDDHLADPWVGHAWTYEPALAPAGSRVLHDVLRQVTEARRARGR